MKYLCLVVSFLALSCGSTEKLFEDALCIQNVNIVSPVDGLTTAQTVVVKDGLILGIKPTSELLLSEENEIIDGSGQFLIPGLWDAHVHFAYIEELAPSMFDLFLKYGITSVRDTGGKLDFVNEWKRKSQENPALAPRVMVAGPLLDGEPNVYDGSDAGHPELSVGIDGLEAVDMEVEKLTAAKVDLLKAYEMLTPEQFRRVMKLADDAGLKVTGHVPLSMDVIAASNAGLNSMEHLRNLEISCASNWEELLEQRKNLLAQGKKETGGVLRSNIHRAQRETAYENYSEDVADSVLSVLKRNDTWQIPTLALNCLFTNRYFSSASWQEDYTLLPDSIGDYWKERSDALTKMDTMEFAKTSGEWMLMMVDKIHKKGIPLMAGTDTPIAYLTPGRSLHEELAMLVKAGLSPLEALRTATVNPARYFQMEDRLGDVREGYIADLVMLRANPLDVIENTTTISAVVKNGQLVKLDEVTERLKN